MFLMTPKIKYCFGKVKTFYLAFKKITKQTPKEFVVFIDSKVKS